MTPATAPIIRAAQGATNPEAGVIEPRPATAPDASPNVVGLPFRIHSAKTHVSEPIAAAMCVARNALPATASAASRLPALNPNQPNQSSPTPKRVRVRLCGMNALVPYPLRLPTTNAATSEATPQLRCTTSPPAKSRQPSLLSHPSPQTQ